MFFPVPRQEFGDAVDFVISDTAKNVPQIGFGVDGIQFAGLDDGIDGRSTGATRVCEPHRVCRRPVSSC